jgi:hypothetical protein
LRFFTLFALVSPQVFQGEYERSPAAKQRLGSIGHGRWGVKAKEEVEAEVEAEVEEKLETEAEEKS